MKQWRINLILILVFIFGAVILSKLFLIQIRQGEYYKALSQGLVTSVAEEESKPRGEIFFKNGEPLAINMEWPFVYSSPKEVKEGKEEIAGKLAEILSLDKDSILEKLNKDNLYEVIKKRISEEEVKKIKELNLTGIYLKNETGRYYPQETLASQVIGFLDAQSQGQYGLEEQYNEVLKGGKKQGNDLVLTLDYAIQFTAEKLLEKAKENLNIENGEIIVIEPNSGKILALANFPNFNPNQYSEVSDFDIFQNAVTLKFFEPGSVFKPITMAAALEEERITSQTTYQDPGVIKIGGYKIYNYDNRKYPGDITMTEVLEKSINTGAVFVEQLLGGDILLKYIEKFGIFEPTEIDVQENYSENKELKKGYEINFATASFGQGIEMTPLQLIRAYAAIANGGKLVKPYLVQKIKASDGEVSEANYQVEGSAVISPKSDSQLKAMLVNVVENGFGKAARVPGYYIAGKTGTSQISFSALGINKKGYSDKTWQSFIGFVPAFNPQFLILVKLNNPETKTAEYSAVPIFHNLAKYIIDYYQIPPDYE